MMNINLDLLQWFINFLIKKSYGGAIKNEITSSKKLAEELHKPTIRQFETEKSTLIFYRKYLGRRSSRYAIDK